MIVDIAVKRPVTVWMFTFAVILFGMVSLSKMNINLLPELSYPTLTIRTDYTGAAPSEVEQLISKPIEEAIGVVKGVRKVKSVSKAGQSDVILEFEWGTSMDIASLEVREKLDVVWLPLDVRKPVLLKFNPSLDPVMRFGFRHKEQPTTSLVSSEKQLKTLRSYAEEEVKRKIESVTGIASVKVGGGLENEIQVLIDQRKTSQLNLSIADISKRLKEENINTSGGRVKDGSQEYLVRTLNQFQSLDDMRDLFVATREGKHVRLGDVAEVIDAHKERNSITRINGAEAVEINLYKEGDANTVEVADAVYRRLELLNKQLPEQYELVQVYDQSDFIRNAISEVKSAAIVGGILAMLVLFLFLKNAWSTFIISISIPVSIIATFNLMLGNEISLNIMSMGGIALAVGMLVDNSIVVLENIDRKKKQLQNNFVAAAKGTKEVSSAITASTLTTMAVFFPLVFVDGIAGQLFSDQALTVTFALLASLVVAITIIPMLAAREKDQQTKPTEHPIDEVAQVTKAKPQGWRKIVYYSGVALNGLNRIIFYYPMMLISTLVITLWRVISRLLGFAFTPVLKVFDIVYQWLAGFYSRALRTAIHWSKTTIVAVIAFAGVTMLLLPRIGMELIPPMSQGEFFIELNLHSGAQLQQTDRYLEKLATFAGQQEQVAKTYSLAGTGSLMNASPGQGGENWGRVNVVMEPSASTQQEQSVINAIREYAANIPGVETKIGRPELFSFSTPLEIELVAYDLEMLKRYADKMTNILDASQRFVDVKTSLQTGYPEVKVYFDHDRLAQLGLSAPQVSKLLASKIGGDVASKFSINDRKVDILVRTDEHDRNSVADIRNIIVNPGKETPIPLDAVADIELSMGPSEITRIAQERVAIVSANLAYGDLGEAVQEANQLIKTLDAPYSINVKVTGQNEEMETSFNSLKFALALAIFLVYLVMASQFESLFHPFLILFTVPMAAAGSIIGLFVTGTNISIVVFIGLIMLAGIVVNNAIVLIDRINQLRAKGMTKTAAILEAAETRFRPILMTTLTTTLGLLPLALGIGDGSEIRTPMAITVIFGLLFSTVLTLLMIPALYSQFDRKKFAPIANESEVAYE